MIALPAILESFRTLKDKSLKVIFETGELTPVQITELGSKIQQFGYLYFNSDVLTSEKVEELSKIKVDFDDSTKSKAQRLRAVLYINWQANNLGYAVFDDYYNFQMEKIITHYKSKLD